jgi:hypothetical protein
VTAEVEVENSGASVVDVYEVVVDPSAVKHLSFVSVSEHGNELPVRKTSDGYVLFWVFNSEFLVVEEQDFNSVFLKMVHFRIL